MIVCINDADPSFVPHTNTPGCSVCSLPAPGHEGRYVKHVRVDNEGIGLVSVPYWEELKKFDDNGGFVLLNAVPEPPRQEISVSSNGSGELTVHHKFARHILTKEK